MKISDFDYQLPEELIAQTPIEPRDASRLMVLDRARGTIEHRIFRDIVEYLRPGDVLVCNQSRVIPARLFGRKVPTGGKVELLLLAKRSDDTWEALVKPGRRVKVGTRIEIGVEDHGIRGDSPAPRSPSPVIGEVIGRTEAGGRLIRFSPPIEPLLDELGTVPLPPYIREPLRDPERYQTVYARVEGSVAAPTAGLHFTPELMRKIEAKGAKFAFVTLHVGLGTFRPVREENVEDHKMHREYCELSPEVARQLNRARAEGGRIIAVGTTSVRVLETAAKIGKRETGKFSGSQSLLLRGVLAPSGRRGRRPVAYHCDLLKLGTGRLVDRKSSQFSDLLTPFSGWTDLFIYPGYQFRAVDALITNFHLPRSTLLMLVCAFAGREFILRAYREAVRRRYRFYSFGDAMFIY